MKQLLMLCCACVAASSARAAVEVSSLSWNGTNPPRHVASAPLAGISALADPARDVVELRDIRGGLLRTLTRADLQSVLPGVTLTDGVDGPSAITFSDSGRLLFISIVHDGTNDALLRYDTHTDQLQLFATTDLGAPSMDPRGAIAFSRGRLFVAGPTTVRAYRARMNDVGGVLESTALLAGARALVVDRDTSTLFAESGGVLHRTSTLVTALTFVAGPVIGPLQGASWADHYGTTARGLMYVTAAAPTTISFVPASVTTTTQVPTPTTVHISALPFSSISCSAEGVLLAARQDVPVRLRETADSRLSFEAFVEDEVRQQIRFARSLITPNLAPGTPDGWVIDADVQLGWSRFHPASPDGAAWTVLLLLASDELFADPNAQGDVRRILTRYSGRAADGIAPLRSADGIYWHWLSPMTGGAMAGWGDSYATMSTMKIVLAADRARRRYPNDAEIVASARQIVCGVTNWERYFTGTDQRMALLGLQAGGPNTTSFSAGWHEGVMFAEQAGAFGAGGAAASRWLNRAFWPALTFVAGRPVTVGAGFVHLPAFITAYSLITNSMFRNDLLWQQHVDNLRMASAAWTDDNSPRYFTVFSAGTTRSDWGGYRADTLASHPGDVTTFPALAALCLDGQGSRAIEAGAAYQAYRRGARQNFLGGASILYRRSAVDLGYQPNSAGLPDVAMGGLGLAELLRPGIVEGVLAGPYASCLCPADLNQDGSVDGDDVIAFFTFWDNGQIGADFNADESVDGDDVIAFFARWDNGC